LLDCSDLDGFKDQSNPVVELFIFQATKRLAEGKIANNIECREIEPINKVERCLVVRFLSKLLDKGVDVASNNVFLF
jgi:hypothetical protein